MDSDCFRNWVSLTLFSGNSSLPDLHLLVVVVVFGLAVRNTAAIPIANAATTRAIPKTLAKQHFGAHTPFAALQEKSTQMNDE